MKRVVVLGAVVALAACRDWETFSAHYGEDAGSTGGGAQPGTGGGAAGGTAGASAGGSAGGASAGGAPVDDPASCDGARPSVCPAGALFCDGFESGLGAWTMDTMNGVVSTFDACSFRGQRALKSTLNAVGAAVAARAKVIEGTSGFHATLWVRVFVRMPGATAPNMRILELSQASPGVEGARLVVSAGQLSAGATSGAVPAATASFPVMRWNCLEWKLVDGAPGTQTVYLDGADVITGPLEVRNLERLGLGGQLTDHATTATPAAEVQYDEVVVDDVRVGCAN